MPFFEDPQHWKSREIHHTDPRSYPPLRDEDTVAFNQLKRTHPDENLPWVVPVGENPPWLMVLPPPLLNYPPFPDTIQKAVKVCLILTGFLFLILLAKPATVGCFLVMMIFLIMAVFYQSRISLPEFRDRWDGIHRRNSVNQGEWQRERCRVTREWISRMNRRREIWKEMMVQDTDRHFAQADQVMKRLASGPDVNVATVKNIEKARTNRLLGRARDAEQLKDYATAARYYHKAGDERKARELNEMSHGVRQYVQVGAIDQSIKITDSVVQRSTIGGQDTPPAGGVVVNSVPVVRNAGEGKSEDFVRRLRELQRMRHQGALSEEEFVAAKLKLLGERWEE